MDMKFTLVFGFAALVLAASNRAESAQPLECHLSVSSLGEALDLTHADPDPRLPFPMPPLQVLWHPPTEDTSTYETGAMISFSARPDVSDVDLFIGYPGATLSSLGASDGARLQFSPGIGTNASEFQAIVSNEKNQTWRFEADPDFSAQQGDFIFSTDDPAGKAVTDAINNGETLKIAILKDGKEAASESFYTGATAGRDKLLTLAKPLIENSDPRYCRPY